MAVLPGEIQWNKRDGDRGRTSPATPPQAPRRDRHARRATDELKRFSSIHSPRRKRLAEILAAVPDDEQGTIGGGNTARV